MFLRQGDMKALSIELYTISAKCAPPECNAIVYATIWPLSQRMPSGTGLPDGFRERWPRPQQIFLPAPTGFHLVIGV